MNDADSISRGEVLNHLGDLFTLCSETGSITEKDLEIFEIIIKSLSPIPQEMTAMEYLKARERLCAERFFNYGCNGCPMLKHKGCDCETIEDNHPDEAVSIVEGWAREHPNEVNDER